MKNMYEVFKTIKKSYINYKIVFDKNYESLLIEDDVVKIVCDDSQISLCIKNKNIDHKHFENENYTEIYDYIIYYMNNYNSILKRKKFMTLIYIIITMIIGMIISLFFK